MLIQETLFNDPQRDYGKDDYWTPKWLFDALGLEFDLDVACPPEGPLHTPCKRYYTQETNGLTSDWDGLVWMNPPYSKPEPWVRKWLKHGNGVAILPNSNGRWWYDLWHDERTRCINVRPSNMQIISFHTPTGKMLQIPTNTLVWAIGENAIKALQDSNLGRVR
jgi:phage N-6-adenine-methyltransferase